MEDRDGQSEVMEGKGSRGKQEMDGDTAHRNPEQNEWWTGQESPPTDYQSPL
jgi:hypothetical protein